ncbi:MAG: hypothetical protein JKX79_07350 [Labilibaculum sp.]|nr:hypothetical protein [Labilibaculum sp.]
MFFEPSKLSFGRFFYFAKGFTIILSNRRNSVQSELVASQKYNIMETTIYEYILPYGRVCSTKRECGLLLGRGGSTIKGLIKNGTIKRQVLTTSTATSYEETETI